LKSWAERGRDSRRRTHKVESGRDEPFICFMWFSLPSVDTSHKQAVKMKCLQARRRARLALSTYIQGASRRRAPLLFSLCSLREQREREHKDDDRGHTVRKRVSSSLARFYPYRFFCTSTHYCGHCRDGDRPDFIAPASIRGGLTIRT
jgi:hypothetical protein